MNLEKFKTFIFDLDGTIWNLEEIFPGAIEAIERLREEKKQILFVTNNTFFSRKELIEKINELGLKLRENELISVSQVIDEYLKLKNASAFVIGESLKEDLAERIDTKGKPDFLVVGYDEKFNLEKLTEAYEILKGGAKFLASSYGKIFIKGNKVLPGAGTIVKAIEHMSGKKAVILGKPSDYMLSFLNMFVCSPMKETVLIGDELESDILLGKKAGFYTILVRTGIDKEASKKIKPDLIIDSVSMI